ncbi:MAG: hypothetical protein FRX48_03635 [Lasallia pustulata]|uniref:Thioester reductase (TE) domain-containing protein n=1 Tax=Lasallia pustulata TaxID=136370 RepID=A0A5M8PVD4_9LECA|nr:MAG: hypothetical protein FRX48_03635 [Lasallia pustulata]
MPIGYAQSKYICEPPEPQPTTPHTLRHPTVERIIQTASKSLNMPTSIFRAGQISDLTSGLWNNTDWIPSCSPAPRTSALPTFTQRLLDWIPIGIAAAAIAELICQRPSRLYSLHHIVNPLSRPVVSVRIDGAEDRLSSS